MTVLSDNLALPGFASEWGFSLYIETGQGQRWLWDAGASPRFSGNAARLGLDLGALHGAALSHGHYDHGDGFPTLLASHGFDGPVAALPGWDRRRWSRANRETPEAVGVSDAARAALAPHILAIPEPAELAPGLAMLGPIPRRPGLEQAVDGLSLDPDGATPDLAPDDTALVLEGAAGPVLVLGCCHSGLANTLAQVRDGLGLTRLFAVLGGMHLYQGQAPALEQARDALLAFGVERVHPGHCAGQAAFDFLGDALPGRVFPLAAGQVLEF